MNKQIIAVDIKRSLCALLILIAFIILLPVFIIGIGVNKNPSLDVSSINGYSIKPNDIVFQRDKANPIIKVYVSSEGIIKEFSLEEYVRGVVAAEMPASFDIEALKAQAVAARTFAISHVPAFGGIRCAQAKGADLCDTVHCQAYMNKEKRLSDWPESSKGIYWNKITDAVKETTGKVIKYNGQLAMNIRYFAVSSGKTENAAEVFSFSEPYLKSVSSPDKEIAPGYQSTFTFKNSEIAARINREYPKAKVSSARLRNELKILSHTSAGSVKEISIGSETITGPKFRSLMGLRSSNFTLKVGNSETQIICLGYGHGVGMSQWGANAMGKSGKNYIDILTHYYQGVLVEKMNN